MAISIIKFEVHIIDTGEGLDITRHSTGRYMRYVPPSYKAVWHYLDSKGHVCEPVYQSDWLEELFRESNGFLEQLELF